MQLRAQTAGNELEGGVAQTAPQPWSWEVTDGVWMGGGAPLNTVSLN